MKKCYQKRMFKEEAGVPDIGEVNGRQKTWADEHGTDAPLKVHNRSKAGSPGQISSVNASATVFYRPL